MYKHSRERGGRTESDKDENNDEIYRRLRMSDETRVRKVELTDLSPPVSSASGEGTLIVPLQDSNHQQRLPLLHQSRRIKRKEDDHSRY